MSIDDPGRRALLARQLTSALAEAGSRGLSRAQLAEAAERAGGRDDLAGVLRRLEAAGDAVEWNSRWYALAATEWVVGELQGLSGGDALLRSGERGEPGYFVRRRYLNGGRSGDRVIAKPLRGRRPAGDKLPEAGVVKVIRRAFDRLVGSVERTGERITLEPFDRRLRVDVELEATEVPDGQWVEAAVDHDASPRTGALRGSVARVFGDIEQPGVDAEVVIAHFGLPTDFPDEVLAAAEALPADPEGGELEGRRDDRGVVVVTIDGATARDFDDAIHVARGPGGGYTLTVYIADVARYVEPGGALDREAYRRGNSVYFADQVLPMLPEALSNGLCSLRPDVPRLVQGVEMTIDDQGAVTASRFFDGVIRSRRRLTYAEVAALLDGGALEGDDGGEVKWV